MATSGARATASDARHLSHLRHRRFGLAEYHRMIDTGILGKDEHVELLEGEIVQMSPMEKPHARATGKLTRWLVKALGNKHAVRVQMPLSLTDSEPEPDLAVVLASEEERAPRHPRTALLVVEVAATSVRHDLDVKARIYARAGIPEYWLVVVRKRLVEILRDPDPKKGAYRTRLTVTQTGRLTASTLPRVTVPVRSLFG